MSHIPPKGGEITGVVEIEWLHRETVRELQIQIVAIRNAIYAGHTMTAMSMLWALRDRIGVYERAS